MAMQVIMPILARALVWGSAFVAFVVVYLPSRVLTWSGASPAEAAGPVPWLGGALVLLGIVPMAWSFLSFVFRGKGTAAPFDPPRLLVVSGPYQYVRNPMYRGAMTSLLGAAVYYRSLWLIVYLAAFALWAHLFVTAYEEPRLRRSFGDEYAAYAARVPRWLPGRPRAGGPAPNS